MVGSPGSGLYALMASTAAYSRFWTLLLGASTSLLQSVNHGLSMLLCLLRMDSLLLPGISLSCRNHSSYSTWQVYPNALCRLSSDDTLIILAKVCDIFDMALSQASTPLVSPLAYSEAPFARVSRRLHALSHFSLLTFFMSARNFYGLWIKTLHRCTLKQGPQLYLSETPQGGSGCWYSRDHSRLVLVSSGAIVRYSTTAGRTSGYLFDARMLSFPPFASSPTSRWPRRVQNEVIVS